MTSNHSLVGSIKDYTKVDSHYSKNSEMLNKSFNEENNNNYNDTLSDAGKTMPYIAEEKAKNNTVNVKVITYYDDTPNCNVYGYTKYDKDTNTKIIGINLYTANTYKKVIETLYHESYSDNKRRINKNSAIRYSNYYAYVLSAHEKEIEIDIQKLDKNTLEKNTQLVNKMFADLKSVIGTEEEMEEIRIPDKKKKKTEKNNNKDQNNKDSKLTKKLMRAITKAIKQDKKERIKRGEKPALQNMSKNDIEAEAKNRLKDKQVFVYGHDSNDGEKNIDKEHIHIKDRNKEIAVYRDGSVKHVKGVTKDTIDDILTDEVKQFLFDIDWCNEL